LAAARACSQLTDLDGTVHFIFQPAEENEGGAKRMMEDGLFRLFPCDTIYALHNWPSLPVGSIVVRDGALMAAFAVFEIEVSGRGCHGAMPHEGTDVVVAGCQLISALQTITSRNVDPRQAAVVSVTQIHAGDTWNTIPEKCVIRGTSRWFDYQVGDTLEHRITEISTAVAAALGCEARVRYERRIPATINDAKAAALIRTVATTPDLNLTAVDTAPSTGSEDFAFMLQAVPGCYVLLGAAHAIDNPGLHSPLFDFNDAVLPIGAALWVSLIRQYLNS
jgi:hippurate hydrolase